MHEDDVKSGVGAQRGGGLHKAYVLALGQELKSSHRGKEGEEEEGSETGSSRSTTSSLFARYFPKVSSRVLPILESVQETDGIEGQLALLYSQVTQPGRSRIGGSNSRVEDPSTFLAPVGNCRLMRARG